MSKQEEISEGMGRFLRDLGFRGLTVNEQREIMLRFLHSQGVVIKSEVDDIDFEEHIIHIFGTKIKVLVPKGYVAVEPLIEERDNVDSEIPLILGQGSL